MQMRMGVNAFMLAGSRISCAGQSSRTWRYHNARRTPLEDCDDSTFRPRWAIRLASGAMRWELSLKLVCADELRKAS
jgi:hypothetical protein